MTTSGEAAEAAGATTSQPATRAPTVAPRGRARGVLGMDTELLGRLVGGPVEGRDPPILTSPSVLANERCVTIFVPLSNGVPTVPDATFRWRTARPSARQLTPEWLR